MIKPYSSAMFGTPEGALRSCVTLIASVTGQPEDLTERYLDLYYQTRRAAELEAERERFLRSWNADGTLTVLTEDVRSAVTAEKTDPETPKAKKKVDFDEVLASASAGAKLPSKPKNAPYGKIKAEIRDRFVALRAQGMTLAQTVNLSGNKVTENQILNIMNGSKVGMDAYNALEDAMNKWEKTVKAADKTDSTA